MSEDAPGEISGAGESSGSPVREPGRAALDPVAAALAVGAAGHDPVLASEAATYFRKQSALLDGQAEDRRDDRALQQAQLELCVEQLRLARISSGLKVATQLLLIVAGVVVGAGALLFIRDAATSRSVVVEAFDAPAGLAPSGLTGQVVAAGCWTSSRTSRRPRGRPRSSATSRAHGPMTSPSKCPRPASRSANCSGSSAESSDTTCRSTGTWSNRRPAPSR